MPADPKLPISASNLSKCYGDFTALDQLSLKVSGQEILGLLGPNGAGKSTFIRLLLGAIRPSAGQASIYGLDCYGDRESVHEKVSYLPGDARLYRRMRGREVLDFFASLRGQKNAGRSTELAKRLDLDLSRRVAAMSTGMRQKLAIATTLSAGTPVLILDEPTANLDPTVRNEVLQIVHEARDDGATVLFSSHVLSEIEDLCDRVVILRKGQKVFEKSLSEIQVKNRLVGQAPRGLPELPPELAASTSVESLPNQHYAFETAQELGPLLQWIYSFELQNIHCEPVGLSRIYSQWDGSEAPSSPADQPSEMLKSEAGS